MGRGRKMLSLRCSSGCGRLVVVRRGCEWLRVEELDM